MTDSSRQAVSQVLMRAPEQIHLDKLVPVRDDWHYYAGFLSLRFIESRRNYFRVPAARDRLSKACNSAKRTNRVMIVCFSSAGIMVLWIGSGLFIKSQETRGTLQLRLYIRKQVG